MNDKAHAAVIEAFKRDNTADILSLWLGYSFTRLTYCGCDLLCIYEYDKGAKQTYDIYGGEPGWPSHVNLLATYHEGKDISELICGSVEQSIEEKILQEQQDAA